MLRLVVLLSIVLAIGGCTRVGAPETPSTPTSPLESPAPTVAHVESVAPTEQPLPSDLDEDIRHAIEMRHGLGLRDDLEFVLQAADDPRADSDYFDFPLYPDEVAKVAADTANQHAVAAVITAYGAQHKDEFGGLYIDRDELAGVVVALWTGHLAAHEAAIRSQVPTTSVFAVRPVKYSEAALRAIQDEVSADWRAPWVAAIPAAMQSVGVDIQGNYVEVGVSSANPKAVEIIEAHYDLGDRLRAESDGTGIALLPWGWISGKVLLPDGSLYRPDEDVTLTSGGPADDPGYCGDGDIGYGVGSNGRFKIPCKVGTRTILVQVLAPGDTLVTVGRGTAVVRTGATARMTITLTEDPGRVARGEVLPSQAVP